MKIIISILLYVITRIGLNRLCGLKGMKICFKPFSVITTILAIIVLTKQSGIFLSISLGCLGSMMDEDEETGWVSNLSNYICLISSALFFVSHFHIEDFFIKSEYTIENAGVLMLNTTVYPTTRLFDFFMCIVFGVFIYVMTVLDKIGSADLYVMIESLLILGTVVDGYWILTGWFFSFILHGIRYSKLLHKGRLTEKKPFVYALHLIILIILLISCFKSLFL